MAWMDFSPEHRQMLTIMNAHSNACRECYHNHWPRWSKSRESWLKQVCVSCPCREYVKP